MAFGIVSGRVVAAIVVAGFIATAAGCKSDDSADVLDPGSGGAQEVPEGKVLQSELRAYCPGVTLRQDYAVLDSYAKNAEDDPSKLMYRSSLGAATRKCTYAPGTLTMEIAVAGRVIPGPLATDGAVKMPIRIEVRRGDEIIYENVASYEVSVSKGSGATQFIYNNPGVPIPAPEAGTIQAFVGYDLPKKKKAEDEL
jgi:hypothetical protein